MQKVAGALKRYNANANDKRVGDCVKRALSLALGMTYNEISSKLNQYRTKLGLSSYTDSRVHMALIEDPYAHGKELSFQEDTLSELKADLQYYQQSYKQYD